MAAFMNKEDGVLKDSISACRKGHTTTSVLLAMKDDILRGMKKGEVTMAVLPDFSKSFDTVDYGVLLNKLHRLGFSKSFLLWLSNYLTRGRKRFVQINARSSQKVDVSFGVPQGSILGPVLFNLCVNDLSDGLIEVTSYQYADDKSYTQGKPTEIERCENQLQTTLDYLSSWSNECNLALNPKKAKDMLFSSPQLARTHSSAGQSVNLTVNSQSVERVAGTRRHGTELQENLN
jgi:hypothetical protein